MSKQSSCSGPVVSDDLDTYLEVFVGTLAKAGYAEKTQRNKERLIAPFLRWMREEGIAIKGIDETIVDGFLACPSRQRYNHRTALQQFIEHLRSFEVLPLRCSKPPSLAEVLFQRYIDYLRETQGLSPRSRDAYSPFIRTFIEAQRLPDCIAALDALAVRSHLLDHSQGRSVSFVRLLAAALRSFLRFCFLDGTTAVKLATAVLPVRQWQLASVPAFLTEEEVERVIATTDGSTLRKLRNRAILLLLARLGLRAGEVVALKLDDIHWDTGEIIVHGKGQLLDRMPLLDEVGEALARYLREARGTSASRRVFLRHIAPRVGLSGPHPVSVVARDALRRAGLHPAGRVGAHIFRHSLATKMIRHGASLEEISQVLRHRSITTTQLYAKVDFESLRSVALPWPRVEVPR